MGESVGESAFVVEPDRVLETGRFVREVSNELKSGLDSVARDVERLMGTWHGRAAQAYGLGWSDVQKGAHEIFDALADMSELLGVTADNYRRCESDNASRTSSLHGLI